MLSPVWVDIERKRIGLVTGTRVLEQRTLLASTHLEASQLHSVITSREDAAEVKAMSGSAKYAIETMYSSACSLCEEDAVCKEGKAECQHNVSLKHAPAIASDSQVGLVFFSRRQHETIEIREWNSQSFSLSAVTASHGDVPVRCTSESLVALCTECRLPSLTIEAESTGDVERQDDSVPLFESFDSRADFLNDAHVLVSESQAWLCGSSILVHVKIGSTDGTGGDSNDDICWVFDLWLFNSFDFDFERAFVLEGVQSRDQSGLTEDGMAEQTHNNGLHSGSRRHGE